MLRGIILSFALLAHPVHVSLMSVEYSEELEVLNVFLKVFSDDFLLDYRLSEGDTSEIDLSSDNEEIKKLLVKYIGKKVQIFADGKRLKTNITKFDPSDGELKIDMVFKTDRRSKDYLIRNLIMTDLYHDQANLLIFKYGEFEEGVRLTPDKKEYSLKVK